MGVSSGGSTTGGKFLSLPRAMTEVRFGSFSVPGVSFRVGGYSGGVCGRSIDFCWDDSY